VIEMPSKYQMIVELASLTANDITSHPHLYPSFLTTAANNYKYSFREQLLIYAQKPDATACADVETWNKLGRWVNKGTKGIALLVDRDIPYKLRHVFDISNTNSFHGYEVKVWKMSDRYEEAVLSALEDSYGEIEHRDNFAEALTEIAGTVVQDNIPDYLEMLGNAKQGSLLENIHESNWEKCFQNLLKNSVAYMLMERCGYDPQQHFDVGDFSEVIGFNTPQTVNILGCATSEIGEMVLREIEATVRSAERENRKGNRTFEKKPEIDDNIAEKENTERRNEYGTDLQTSGGLRTPEPEHSGEPEDRQIWNVAAHLPPRASQDRVQRTDAVRQDEQSSGGNRPTGDRDDGIAHEADGTDRASKREPQSDGSDEMGSVDEQHPEPGGGNRTDGSGLQLSHHDYNGRQEKDYYYSSSEKNELMRNCIALKDHRAEIATFFAENENRDERGNFIKSFFDGESVSHTLESGQVVGYRAFDDLIQIWHGEYDTRDKEDFIQWWRLADYINGQMLLDEWLDHDEKPFPSEAEQISFIAEQGNKKTNGFVLPQAAIDYVLTRGSGVSEGKYRIQEQFLKKEGKEKNIAFLKNEYGIGGHSDAIPGSGLWESHEGKGITIAPLGVAKEEEKKSYLITWSAAEKRIGELIAADRYLNSKEKEYYPEYHRQDMARQERTAIGKEFISIVRDFNDFEQQIGNEGAMLNQYVLNDCAQGFMIGEKRTGFISRDGDFIIPLMREAMEKVLAENTHHKDRAASMLAQLHGVHAKKLEPTYDELNPPPEPEKEYKFSLGDTVFIGAQEYEILSLDGDTVTLFDTEFPLLNKDMPRDEFDAKVKENPLNDKYLQVVEDKVEEVIATPDNAKARISLNSGDDLVHWIYFNPDADAGGQYVSGDLAFSVYEELIEIYDIANHPENTEKFVSDLEEMSDQFLADVRTPFFAEAENDYEMDCDYIEFTPENILKIHEDIQSFVAEREAQKATDAYEAEFGADGTRVFRETEKLPVFDRETEILYDVLGKLKMDDVELSFDENGLVATDSMDNVWHGKEFYNFLVEDAFVFQKDGSVLGLPDELTHEFGELCEHNGVEFRDHFVSPFDEYEMVKKENPDAVVVYKVGDFFEMFGERDTQIAHEVLGLVITKREFTNKSITTPMCGFPYHVTEQYVQKLLGVGHDVVAVTHEPGEKLEVRRILATAKNKEIHSEAKHEGRFVLRDTFYDGEKDNQWAVWDKVTDDYYIDLDNLIHSFETEQEAKEYLAEIEKESEPKKPYIDHYYVVEDLQAVPLEIKTFSELDKALSEYFSLPTEKVKAFGVQNTNELPGSLDFIQCKDGVDTLTEDYLKVEERAGWQNDEIIGLENRLKEEIDKHAKPLAPPPAPVKSGKLTPHILYPEIKSDYRTNYQIEDDDIGVGTPLDRFYHNVHAIQLLKKLESEHRLAQPHEQNGLANYVGWGGLPQFFEETNPHYAELKELLTEDEYASARESTLTAFYTPPVVIKAMYKALENMNFKTGNVLEPSCGIGNFMGLVPDSMSDAKFYGVELDSISGRIAQQLYQKNSIAVQGFEDTKLPDSFFDAAIGNVPFGQFKVPDKRYDKHNFLIHDYFFARTLDKVRPGGVIAFITSSGTMDKENPSVRKYIAQRADLLGAIRLPNNTFKDAAGTEVTADIIFLQKRDRLIDIEPDWVHLNTDENGIKMNSYFVDNPDMIMGEMQMISGPHGPTPACIAYDDADLGEQLNNAIQNIHAEITEVDFDDIVDEEIDNSIPADPDVRNFSYTVVDGTIYYRENSRMNPVDVSATAESRIKGMIGIRDCVRTLIEYQTEDYPDYEIKKQQDKLNELYDAFSKKYGIINSRANSSAFNADSSYCLLSSLEILDDEGQFIRKADMFTKRTIKQKVVVDAVDTASEALALSLAEKAAVDIPYMCELTGKSEDEIVSDLTGVIFLNPSHIENRDKPKYLPADEYLSGNIREKLRTAERCAELNDSFLPNVKALQAVMPKDLSASEISVRLGATWLPPEDVEKFMFELFDTVRYMQWNIKVHYSEYTGEWNIEGKSYDRSNIKVHNTYGTSRINGYKIIEETLNLHDVRIFDYVEDENGNKKPVLNKKETAIAQGKQQLIKEAFAEWIWKDPERRERLTKLYNEKFNSVRPREYNGEHLNFVGMNPEIRLRPHQVNAIAHILYGGNTLLAHVVGAGKTFEMVAAAQESKRLGLCKKSLFVVPNHLTEQWAAEYLQLYPSANILVATKKDFETKNRKKFCGRIATGDYDAIIIGHSQFEKIPMSIERQRMILEQQLYEIVEGIKELKQIRGDNFSVKQLEKTKKSVKQKLEKLNDQTRKDDVVTFEELGVDRLFIDEAHYYKNLAAFTKMRNVGGISQTEAQKSSDLYMKCRYLDELTGGKGVVFATGTPISNSMVELYTMQKYLQYNTLKRNNLIHFDAWASTFGETVTAIELAPEGTGYRAKTRFAKFYNLPELMAMFKETADIQTADMLHLPVPEAHYHTVALKPSEQQKEMVASLSERAERVRNKMVDSTVDNMLLITNDGRKLALDQRMMNDMLPDSETSKVSVCADNIFDIWQRTTEQKSAQMVFCDLSTPHGDGTFNVYDDLRDKLIAKGIPAEEIAYIHSANTEVQKKEMFGKVRSGQIRVLIGSTQKMGAGTNVQKRLIALHHLDCPWRPSDLQQREGRIIRQGNENPEVDIYTYVTENTFDSYLYQLVESKQKFIGQIMTSKSPVRSAEDVDEQALSYAEIKALCTGNPYIKEKMDLDIDVSRLKLLKANHLSQKYSLEDKILKEFPNQIAGLEQRIVGLEVDMKTVSEHPVGDAEHFCGMEVKGKTYIEKKDAGEAIIAACKAMTKPEPIPLGYYRGFEMELNFDSFSREYMITLKGKLRHTTALGTDTFGNIQRLDNLLDKMPEKKDKCVEQLGDIRTQLANAKVEVEKPFPHEEELKTKTERLAELNSLLDMDKKENEIVDDDRGEDDEKEPERSDSRDER
jgi:N12 class adenine-specific DNA methylase/adenine-specific DNA methylase